MDIITRFLAFLLTISLSLLVVSCAKTDIGHTNDAFYPEGYTCGFPNFIRQPGSELEFWWVETYDECLSAIDLLKSHGSTFAPNAIFSYEGDLFDTKYCIKISGNNINTERIEFGENPFDRKAFDVEITAYAFFEDVSIEEINYGDIRNYNVYELRADRVNKALATKQLSYEWETNSVNRKICYVSSDNGALYCKIVHMPKDYEDTVMSDECIRTILEHIWVIE